MPSGTGHEVRDNPDARRYELLVDGRLVGTLDYRSEPGAVVLQHAEIEPALRGRGLGSRLVGDALDDLRTRGLAAVPLCPFVDAYVRRNPEYADLVAGHRATRR